VPDVSGRSARAALRALAKQGFEVELEGSGRVVTQQPAAGFAVAAGSTVRLTLEAGP
jgi:beta-lactam-binding protein with PASTA domain